MSLKNILMRRRGLGWTPNPPDTRDLRLSFAAERAEVPLSFTLLKSYDILQQASTNSCVAQSLAQAVLIAEKRKRLDTKLVSRLFMYFNSRSFEGLTSIDRGTTIRSCCKGLVKFGAPDERYWDFTTNPIFIGQRPGWKPYMMGYGRKGGAYYRIYETGSELVTSILSALLDGHPIIFGAKIPKSFTANTGPEVIARPGDDEKIIGGHCMTIVGWRTSGSKVEFEIVNSWGESWRNYGTAYIEEDYIKSSLCRDFTIIKGWNRIKNVR